MCWDLNTLQPRNTLQHGGAVSALRWIPGTRVCTGANARSVVGVGVVGGGRRRRRRSAFFFLSLFALLVPFRSAPRPKQRKGLARLPVPARRWTSVLRHPTRSDNTTVHRAHRARMNNLRRATFFSRRVRCVPSLSLLRLRPAVPNASPTFLTFPLPPASSSTSRRSIAARAWTARSVCGTRASGRARRRATATPGRCWDSRRRRTRRSSPPRPTTAPRACLRWRSLRGVMMKRTRARRFNNTITTLCIRTSRRVSASSSRRDHEYRADAARFCQSISAVVLTLFSVRRRRSRRSRVGARAHTSPHRRRPSNASNIAPPWTTKATP